MRIKTNWIALFAAAALAGCVGTSPTGDGTGGSGGTGTGSGTGSGSGGGGGGTDPGNGATGGAGGSGGMQPPSSLTNRQIDYGQALRTAALKLTGNTPSGDEVAGVTDATSYAAQIDKYLADPRFAVSLKAYFSDMMKMGGKITVPNGNAMVTVSLDTAPTYAAELVVKDQAMTNLFTGTTNTCPTMSATGAFTDASCTLANGLAASGVLTDPGAMAQFYSNMAFRRVRWIQEAFVCNAFPTEFSGKPVAMGAGQFVSPWPFTSISGGTGAPINFQDTSSVICANCHETMNHIAPLFAKFDITGVYQTTIQVHTPTPMTPLTQLTDWLPTGQQTFAWRYGKNVNTITDLGNAMAADSTVMSCQVRRAWNWAMSKTDIVTDLSIVPDSVITSHTQLFTSNGYLLKPVLKAIFTSDDFVKF
jgi:hypothetical protein